MNRTIDPSSYQRAMRAMAEQMHPSEVVRTVADLYQQLLQAEQKSEQISDTMGECGELLEAAMVHTGRKAEFNHSPKCFAELCRAVANALVSEHRDHCKLAAERKFVPPGEIPF